MIIPLKDDNPLHRIPFQYVTVALIAACIIVWLVQWLGGDAFDAEIVFRLGMIPATVIGEAQRVPEFATIPPWSTLITSMFLHGGFWHLAGNMLYLWIFGDNVEDAMGHWRFLVFYLLCGVAAGLLHLAADPSSQVPTIGASGAISGVLGAYFVLHPKRGIWMLFFFAPIRVPAWAVLGIWAGYQVLNALTTSAEVSGVAWWAHIGGFIAGALLVIPMRRRGVLLFDGVPIGPWNRRPRAVQGAWAARWSEPTERDPRDGPWGRRPRSPRPWDREE